MVMTTHVTMAADENRSPDEAKVPEGRSWRDRIPPVEARGTHWSKSKRASRAGTWNEHFRNFAF